MDAYNMDNFHQQILVESDEEAFNSRDPSPEPDDTMISASKGCGFNAHGQVDGYINKDYTDSQPPIRVPVNGHFGAILLAKWAYTIIGPVGHGEDAFLLGHNVHGTPACQKILFKACIESDLSPDYFHTDFRDWSFIGTALKPIAAVGPQGRMFRFECTPQPVFREISRPNKHDWLNAGKAIKCMAMNAAGKISVTIDDSTKCQTKMIAGFPTFERFVQWYQCEALDGSNNQDTESELPKNTVDDLWVHHMGSLDGSILGLVAGSTAFAAWTLENVYTWGSELHPRELGRPTSMANDRCPTRGVSRPCPVQFASDQKVRGWKKVVAQDTTYAVLTTTGTLFLWGNDLKGFVPENEPESRLRLGHPPIEGEAIINLLYGIKDVALGKAHLLVMEMENDKIWGIGDNKHHQIPCMYPSKEQVLRKWTECSNKAHRLWAGPLTTFWVERFVSV